MAAPTTPYQIPNYIAQSGTEPKLIYIPPEQGATFTVGDVVVKGAATTSTAAYPAAATTIAGSPLWSGSSNLAYTTTASSGAPATTYWLIVQYTANATVTGPASTEYAITIPAGFVPVITSPDASTGASSYQVFASNQGPGTEIAQFAGIGTSIGTQATLASPLTWNIGAARAATNASGSIYGIAAVNFNAAYSSFGLASQTSVRDKIGPTYNNANNSTNEQLYSQIISGFNTDGGLQEFEFSLVQPLNNGVFGAATAGIAIDSATGLFVADTSQSNKVLNVLGAVSGPSVQYGANNQTGARVRVTFVSTDLISA